MQENPVVIGPVSFQEVQVNHNPRLTASETAGLWGTFMQYTMLSCMYSYYKKISGDQQTKDLMANVVSLFEKRVHFVTDVFNKEAIPIPMGFTAQDVNLNAPTLFSENFLFHFTKNMLRVSMTLNSLNLNMSSRPDITEFYTTILTENLTINTQLSNIMLAKGIMPRPPYAYISPPVEHIHHPGFLTGFFGDKRPLLTIEVAHLYHNALANEIGRQVLLAYRQVATNKEVKDYFTKGMGLADRIVETLTRIARIEDIEFAYVRDSDITGSTVPPFSDKLMMFQISFLNSIGAGMYGVSGSVSFRHDLMKVYGQIMLEVGTYAEEGAGIMMKNDWLEEPPQVIDREELAGLKH